MKRRTAILAMCVLPSSGLASSSGASCGNEKNSGEGTRTLYHRFIINTRKSSYGPMAGLAKVLSGLYRSASCPRRNHGRPHSTT
ncbi:hypothetical protein B0H14DRAFT_1323086 [Mycena olivaceomarginata]|nr:hypothetical protein B0H14DRAFT_1323086 [Mycena olivaceomarginata]